MAEEKVTLPCHHQLGLQEKGALDIEWLLTDSSGNQKAVSQPQAPHSPCGYALASPQPSCFSLGHKGLELLFAFFESSLEDMFFTNFRKRGRERSIGQLPPVCAPTGDPP